MSALQLGVTFATSQTSWLNKTISQWQEIVLLLKWTEYIHSLPLGAADLLKQSNSPDIKLPLKIVY